MASSSPIAPSPSPLSLTALHRFHGCPPRTSLHPSKPFRLAASASGDGQPHGAEDAASETPDPRSVPGTKPPPTPLSLRDVNPVGLGRKSRQVLNQLWRRFTELGQLSRSPGWDQGLDNAVVGGPMCDFTIPGAESTTVLVAGATSRVGRIVVRKLQLRGYKVKALLRKANEDILQMLPSSVQVVVGELGDPSSLKNAVEGCNKVIFCATARSSITGDLYRVDHKGVYNLTKAFQDYNHKQAQLRAGRSSKSKLVIAKFSEPNDMEGWEVREGKYFFDNVNIKYDAGMDARFETNEENNAVFLGYVFTRGGFVELAKKLSLPAGLSLDRFEGLLLSICGDGKAYSLILEACAMDNPSQNMTYFARFSTRIGYSRVRIPFNTFRPLNPEDPPLDPFSVHTIGIRFELRRQRSNLVSSMGRNVTPTPTVQDNNSFKLLIDYIKALPGGQETDFILVTCAGSGIDPGKREKVLKAKQGGEMALRNSGLGYTIIRPGPLQEEPGGQRALVFDQGNRISQSISCADVADICVKALHNPAARNRSFDVCYEYIAKEGQGLYELVAHLPDKSNNYLTPALSVLERNT